MKIKRVYKCMFESSTGITYDDEKAAIRAEKISALYAVLGEPDGLCHVTVTDIVDNAEEIIEILTANVEITEE